MHVHAKDIIFTEQSCTHVVIVVAMVVCVESEACELSVVSVFPDYEPCSEVHCHSR